MKVVFNTCNLLKKTLLLKCIFFLQSKFCQSLVEAVNHSSFIGVINKVREAKQVWANDGLGQVMTRPYCELSGALPVWLGAVPANMSCKCVVFP